MSLKKGNRVKSCSLSDDIPIKTTKSKYLSSGLNSTQRKPEDIGKFFKYIDENIIGKGVAFLGPFGRRKVIYADYATSGRSLQFLEDYINKEVLPAFGDDHCSSSVTGLQSKLYCNEAKDIIHAGVNGSNDDQIYLFEGSHINLSERLCHLLCFSSKKNYVKESENFTEKIQSPVLFVSTNEPKINLTPWENAGLQIVKISKTKEGFLDLVDLENKLSMYTETKRLLIGLFAGISRLNGIVEDDVATTILLHQFGALSIWDFSSAAPFVPINMNPTLPGASKEAIYFNTNKFIGGVQGPGVLIVKKALLSHLPKDSQKILESVGTIGFVRAGLLLQLKDAVGTLAIANRQEKLCKQIIAHIRTIPEIVVLGSSQISSKRIPLICFLVKHPRGAFLHHKFVVAVLNDIFGIQATAENNMSECLGISKELLNEYELILSNESNDTYFPLHPGYTKILIPYFLMDSEVAFLLEALKMVATEAWKLLPQYVVDKLTGEWKHYTNSLIKERKWLSGIRYVDGKMHFSDRRISGPGTFPQNYSDCLQVARNLFNRSRKMAQKNLKHHCEIKLDTNSTETLRWFMLPGEAHELLLGHSQNVKNTVPFDPAKNKEINTPPISIMLRHNSLSVLDLKHFKSRSLPSTPVQLGLSKDKSSIRPSSPKTKSLSETTSNSIPLVRFTLGDETITFPNFKMKNKSYNDGEMSSQNRFRCHSWSSTGAVKSISNKARISLGIASKKQFLARKQIVCSCSSQTELCKTKSDDIPSPTPSLQNGILAGSICSDCTEDLHAYVTEVTKELATEIKSEIREVITKVEDVLENTDAVDLSSINMSSMNNIYSSNELRSDSVSATDVAEYLKEFSKEMTSEVKSEIREAVNAMSDITTPETFNSSRRSSPPDVKAKLNSQDIRKSNWNENNGTNNFSTKFTQNSLDDNNSIQSELFTRPNSTPGWTHQTAPSPETSTPYCPYTGAISKLVDPVSTTSQDSGINMCFHDIEETRARTLSENSSDRPNIIMKRMIKPVMQEIGNDYRVFNNQKILSKKSQICDYKDEQNLPTKKLTATEIRRPISDGENDKDFNLWHHLPKTAWKQTSEAIDEFNMIKNGDRIIVCLSGSCASLCLLHALRQFSRARGISIQMAAVKIGDCGVDPRALMLYMRDISVDLYFEQKNPSDNFKNKIIQLAKRKNFNVIAMANTLDKLADSFLVSLLNKGCLNSLQAHCITRESNIRIIRPFLFVREKILEDFALRNHFPARLSKLLNKPLDASNSILKVQECINPNVYDNIKTALRPLLAARLESDSISREYLRLCLISRN